MAQAHYKALLGKALLVFIAEKDPVLAMLEWVAHQMMLIEAEGKVGAEKGKHSRHRKTYFSGVRVWRMDTRLGTIYLYVLKLRKGGYVPLFVTERKRLELALAALVQKAFINGVSTRRVERLAQVLGIENISASQVSEINRGLEEQVEYFRSGALEEEYPFLWIDAHYDKVRVEDRVVTLALMIAHGVNSSGMREILAAEPMFDESEDSWQEFFRKLKKRGLRRVCLCVSDAHSGLQIAVKKELLGASWQRCKVHFMRNILAKVPHKDKRRFAAHLKQIWLQPDRKSARRAADQLAQEYGDRFAVAIRCLEEGLEDSLQFYGSPRLTPRISPRPTCRSGLLGRSAAGVGWSECFPQLIPGCVLRRVISWSTRRIGGPTEAISNVRRSRRLWKETVAPSKLRRLAEEGYDGSQIAN